MKQPTIKIFTRCTLHASRFFIIIAFILGIKGYVLAIDDPHSTSNTIGCNSCHAIHKASGSSLTKNASNANLCLSCHDSVTIAKPLDATMLPTPGVTGTSHSWTGTMPGSSNSGNQYGLKATADISSSAMKMRLQSFNNVVSCSVCHNQHSQAKTTWDPNAPSSGDGRHMQRISNDINQMCEDCHYYRAMSYSRAKGEDGSYQADGTKKFSHPVGETLNSQGYDKTAPLDYDGGAQQTSPRYHENSATESPANSTNNLVLDSSTKVRCMSCHRMHYVDSNGATEDIP